MKTLDDFIKEVNAEMSDLGFPMSHTTSERCSGSVAVSFVDISTTIAIDKRENIAHVKPRLIESLKGVIKMCQFDIDRLEANDAREL